MPSKNLKTEENLSEDEEYLECPAHMVKTLGVQRYLLAIEYMGTRFFGSQKQPHRRTVAGTLEEAFLKFTGLPISLVCSSRTDAGVHSLFNVFHVDVERKSKRRPGEVLPPHEPTVVQRAINHFLQKEGDIMVVDARRVSSDFHARYMARQRTYYYRLLSGSELISTFEKDRAWHVMQELDLLSMQKACEILVGHYDFSSFRASGCQAKSPIRTLEELTVTETPPPSSFSFSTQIGFGGPKGPHRCFIIKASSSSFLYHQVRLIVGLLKSVGVGHLTLSDVTRILEAKTVTAAPPMAPACGLYLGCVKYDRPPFS